MIDTVVLRIHNWKRNYQASDKYFNLKEKKGYTIEDGIVPTEEAARQAKFYKNPDQLLKILKLNNTGEYLIKTQTGKRKTSSGHYELSYSININEDFLEMNFSIPKYTYGTNVCMYVEHLHDVNFKYYENSLLEYNVSRAPDLFFSFIKYFLNKEFIYDKINPADVEINRIDLCFNQIFKTKEEALYFHNYQKKIRKKYSRDEDGRKIDYDTSVMFATSRYGAKIYHKGSEYKKNDLKQHLRINAEKGDKIFDTEKIQDFADRILRYEITFRKTELNYLFKHNIFRNKCPQFNIDYKVYKRVSAIKQRNDRIAKAVANQPQELRAMYLKYHPYEVVKKTDKLIFKITSHIMESSPSFRLNISEGSKLWNSSTIDNVICKTALFSTELLTLCFKKLVSFINEFQLKELPNEEKVSIDIDKYNSTHKSKLPRADMLQFYDLLVKHVTFREAARVSRYSRATLYRYKARFKKIGITEINMTKEENFIFPEASLDLKEYHAVMMYKLNIARHRRVQYGL